MFLHLCFNHKFERPIEQDEICGSYNIMQYIYISIIK